jgi:recombination protein RecT
LENTALQLTPQARMTTIKDALEKNLSNFRAVAARHLTPERVIKVVLGAASRSPFILNCTPVSIVKSALQAAELGLEPGSSLGEFWLVPFKNNKTGQWEAQGIPGYRGLISLARRTGEISNLYAEAVYDGDTFNCELGLDPKLEHKPDYDNENREDAKNLSFVYAVARFKGGSFQFVVLSRKQVDALRRRSKAGDKGPWVTDYEEMAKKTAIRRLSKYLPLSAEMSKALDLQARAESGSFDEPIVLDADITIDGDEPPALPESTQPAKGKPSLKESIKRATAGAPEPNAGQQ